MVFSIKLKLMLFGSVTYQNISLPHVKICIIVYLEGITCQNKRASKVEDDLDFDT